MYYYTLYFYTVSTSLLHIITFAIITHYYHSLLRIITSLLHHYYIIFTSFLQHFYMIVTSLLHSLFLHHYYCIYHNLGSIITHFYLFQSPELADEHLLMFLAYHILGALQGPANI